MKKTRKIINFVLIGMVLAMGVIATYHMEKWIQDYDQVYLTYENKYDIETVSPKAYSYLFYAPNLAKDIPENEKQSLQNHQNIINLYKTTFTMEEQEAKQYIQNQTNKIMVENEVYGELIYFEPYRINKMNISYQLMFTKDFKNIYYGLQYDGYASDEYIETAKSLVEVEDEENRKEVLTEVKQIINQLNITTIHDFEPDSISLRKYALLRRKEDLLKTYVIEDKKNKITICYDGQNKLIREFILGFDS